MSLNLLSYPQIVFIQASQPDVVAGRFWIDSDTNEIFYCNGSAYVEISTGAGGLLTPIMENTLAIMEIFAADTLTAGVSATMVRDVFSDSGGYLNTVDAGNTTAGFSTDKYNNSALTTDAGPTVSNSTSQTTKEGMKFETNFTCRLKTITKDGSCDATTAYLLDSSKAVLATASFSGNAATFDYALANATSYYAAVDKGGAAYTRRTEGGQTYPIADTNVDWTAGLFDNGDSAVQASSVVSITTDKPVNKIVQTNQQTLASTPTSFQVYAYKKNLTGTGGITADISFDGGAHYQTGVPLDAQTDITNTGTGMILKLNLNAGATVGGAECKGYGVLYW